MLWIILKKRKNSKKIALFYFYKYFLKFLSEILKQLNILFHGLQYYRRHNKFKLKRLKIKEIKEKKKTINRFCMFFYFIFYEKKQMNFFFNNKIICADNCYSSTTYINVGYLSANDYTCFIQMHFLNILLLPFYSVKSRAKPLMFFNFSNFNTFHEFYIYLLNTDFFFQKADLKFVS